MVELTFVLIASTLGATAPSVEEMRAWLQTVDQRTSAQGDYEARVYIEQKQRGRDDLLYEAAVYRRDAKDELMILFLRPKSEAGKGYLRLDENLFIYDPSVGRWERRTERERIAGTNSRRQDFDERRLADEFDPTYVDEEKLGAFKCAHLRLQAKADVDVAYPTVDVWIDRKSGNLLKQQEFALSGKLMRTSYYPKWGTVDGPKGQTLYYARETRVFDELEKGTSTTVVVRSVDLSKLPANMFTKAWLESKSR